MSKVNRKIHIVGINSYIFEELPPKLQDLFKNTENITELTAELNNNFSINFDKTYKIKNYNYKSSGKIIKAN